MQPAPPKASREYDNESGTGSTGAASRGPTTTTGGGGSHSRARNRGPKKQTAKELIAERARIDAAMEQVDAAKAKARAQRAEYGRYLKWKVDLQHKERKSREQEDIAMRAEVEEKLKKVLDRHREQSKEDRSQWKKFTQSKVRKQEPLWLDNGLEKERQWAQQQTENRRNHIEASTKAFRETVPKSAPAGGGAAGSRRAPPHHLPRLGESVRDDSPTLQPQQAAQFGATQSTHTNSPGKQRGGKDQLEYYLDPVELHDPHRQLRKTDDGVWVEQRRAADHRLYFLNRKTKEKTWDVLETPFATLPFIDPDAVDLTLATDEESMRQLRDQRLRDPNRPLRKIGRWLEKRRPNDNKLYFLNYENKTTTVKVDETLFAKMPFEDYTAEESAKELEKDSKEKAKFFDPNRPLRTCPHWAEERDEDGNILFVTEKKITKNVDETPFAFLSLDEGVKKLTAAEKIMAQSKATGALDLPAVWSLTALPPMQTCNYSADDDSVGHQKHTLTDKSTPEAVRAARLQRESMKHFNAVSEMYEKARTRRLYATGRMQADPPADYMLGTDILRYIPAEVLEREDGQDMALIGDIPEKPVENDTVFLTQDGNGGFAPGRTQDTDLAQHDVGERRKQLGGLLVDPGAAPGQGTGGKNYKWKKWNPDAWMNLPNANRLTLNEHREPEEEAATLSWYKNYHEQYTRVKKRTEYHGTNYQWKKSDKYDLPAAKNIAHDRD